MAGSLLSVTYNLWTWRVCSFPCISQTSVLLPQIWRRMSNCTTCRAHHLFHAELVAAQLPGCKHEAVRIMFLRSGEPIDSMDPTNSCANLLCLLNYWSLMPNTRWQRLLAAVRWFSRTPSKPGEYCHFCWTWRHTCAKAGSIDSKSVLLDPSLWRNLHSCFFWPHFSTLICPLTIKNNLFVLAAYSSFTY